MEDRPIGVDDSSSIDLALQFGLAKGTDESHDAADGQGGSGVVVEIGAGRIADGSLDRKRGTEMTAKTMSCTQNLR